MLSLVGCGFLWLLGYLVDAIVVQQVAWVAAFVGGVWAILGNRIAWAIAFPLAFLVFLIPFGEDLVPIMMEFTADFTIGLVRLTGIPVYREGLFFSLPSGHWSVVEACSGIRYLIASVTLGCLYAYLTYSSLKKRLIFIAVSIVVPVIANGLRAYIIVMLGHVSDMTIATGVDHLVYGWLFFGFIIFLMILAGARFRDEIDSFKSIESSTTQGTAEYGFSKTVQAVFLSICLIGLWPVFAHIIDENSYRTVNVTQSLSIGDLPEWNSIEQAHWSWEPPSHGTESTEQFFEKDNVQVGLYLHYLFVRKEGVELINSQNMLVAPNQNDWRVVGAAKRTLSVGANNLDVNETLLKGADSQLLVWSWYRVGEYNTTNKYIAKLLEGFNRLTFGRQDEGKIILAVPFNEIDNIAKRSVILQGFIQDILPQMEEAVDKKVAQIQ
jgi:exosortase A